MPPSFSMITPITHLQEEDTYTWGKIEQKFLAGQEIKGSWKVAENQIIKQQNTLLQKILDTFGESIRCIIIMEGAIK